MTQGLCVLHLWIDMEFAKLVYLHPHSIEWKEGSLHLSEAVNYNGIRYIYMMRACLVVQLGCNLQALLQDNRSKKL